MQQYTSEEALNGILNIIDTVVKEHAQALAKKPENSYQEVGDLVTALLGGVAAGSSSNVNLGTQIKDLADGMSMFKDKGITDSDAKTVAGMISTLGESISKLEFSEANVSSVQSVAQALVMFGSIDSEIVDRINRLGLIDFSIAERMNEFIKKLNGVDGSIDKFVETMNSFSGIDYSFGDKLADFVKVLGEPNVDVEKIKNTISIVVLVGLIDLTTIDNINNLAKLDYSGADKLREFVEKLDFTKIGAMNEKRVNANIAYISKLLGTINDVINQKTSTTKLLLAPLRGWLIGKSIANFLKAIVNAVDAEKKGINIRILGVADIMNVFAKFAEKNSKYSIRRLKKVMSYKNGVEIGKFFTGLMSELPYYDPKDKKSSPKIQSVVEIIKLFSEFGFGKYIKLRLIMTEDNGKKLGKFFSGILNEIPDGKTADKSIRAIAELIKVLTKVSLLDLLTIKLLGSVLTEKLATNINKFVTKLINGFDDSKMKRVHIFGKTVKDLTSSVLILTGCVLLMAASIAIFGFLKILESVAVITAFTSAMLFIFKLVAKHVKEIEKAEKGIMKVAMVVSIMTLNVLLVALLAEHARKIDWEDLGKVAAIYVFIGVLAMAMIWVGNKWQHGGKNAMLSMIGIAACLLVASIALGIVIDVAQHHKMEDVITGVSMLLLTVGFMVGMVAILNHIIKKKDILWGIAAMVGLSAVLVITSLALGLIIEISARHKMEDILLGTGILLGTILGLVLMTKLLKSIDSKDILWGVLALASMVVIMLGVALITGMLIAIGKPEVAVAAALGAFTVLMIILALELEILLLKKIKPTDMLYSMAVLAGMAFLLLGVSLIAKELLIPIGKEHEAMLWGAGTVLALITVFGLIMYGIGKLAKNKEDDLIRGGLVIGGIALVIAAISAATLLFLEVAKTVGGMSVEDILEAGAVQAALLTAFGLIMYGVGKLADGKTEQLIVGGLVIAGISAIIAAMSGASLLFIELAKSMKEVTIGDILGASAVMGALLVAFGALSVGIGLLVDGTAGIGAAVILSGLAILLSIAGTIVVMSEATRLFCEVAVQLSKYKVEDITKGGLIMSAVLLAASALISTVAVVGAIGATLGTFVIPMLTLQIKLITSTVDMFAEKLLDIKMLNGSDKWEGGQLLKSHQLMLKVVDGIIDLIDEFLKIELQLTFFDIDNSIKASKQIIEVMNGYIDVITKAVENLQPSDITAFNAVIVGKTSGSSEDVTSMIGSIIACIKAFQKIETALFFWDIDSSIDAAKQIIEVCSMFMDVVARVATLQYIVGYDLNGKPMYDTISPDDFGKAAEVVTTKFFEFVQKVGDGFKNISYWSTWTIDAITDSMKPLIDCVARFVDVVLKVSTGQVLNGYVDGKPQYIALEPEMFTAAADAITTSFLGFVGKLSENVKGMNDDIVDLIEDLGEALMPMMNSISSYVEAIMKLATGTYTITEDEKQVTKTVTPEMFMNAATKVTDSFMTFLTKLDAELKNLDDDTAEIIEDMGAGLGVMMQGVGSYIDSLMKMATGTYLVGYDANGKGIYQHVTDAQINTAADAIVNKFKTFLQSMITFIENNDLDEDCGEILEALGKGVGPIMKSTTSFAEAILKIATGSYQTGVDKNGNPTFKKLTYNEIKLAAGQIIGYYTQFVGRVMDLAKRPDFQGAGQKAMQLLGKSVQPIMDSAVDFANMLVMFLKPHGTIKNALGKEVPFRLDMKTIGDASKKIADAYMTFVDTLTTRIEANKTLQANIKRISQYMKDISSVVSMSAKSATDLSNLLETMSKIKGLDNAAANNDNSLIVKFTKALSYLGDDIMNTQTNFKLAYKQYTDALSMLNVSANASKKIKEVIDNLNGIKALSKYQTLCSNFAGAITELTKIPGVIPNIQELIPFITRVNIIANQLKVLEGIMNNADITKACQKFIKDIEILTQQGLTKKVDASRRALGMFGNDLKVFTKQVVVSNRTVIKFTNSMNDATKSLSKFDDLLIKKEKQRNEAIQHMAELIERTAEAVKSLQKNIESLDQNKILENFRAISELLELAKAEGEKRANPDNKQNNQNNQQNQGNQQLNQNGGNQNGGNTTVVNNGRNVGKQMCNFYFQNVSFSGFMETKNI